VLEASFFSFIQCQLILYETVMKNLQNIYSLNYYLYDFVTDL